MRYVIFIIFVLILQQPANTQTDYWMKTSAPSDLRLQAIAINSSDHIFFSSLDSTVYRSMDNGLEWTRVNKGIPYESAFGLLVAPNSDLFAGSRDLVYSTDGGDNWSIRGSIYFAFCFAFKSPDTLFAGTGGGVYRSDDYGLNWVKKSDGIPDPVFGDIPDICLSQKGDLFAAALGHGILRSSNSGENWMEVNNGLPYMVIYTVCEDDSGQIFFGSDSGIYKSANEGVSWWKTNYASEQAVISLVFDPLSGCLFAGTDGDGVWYSDDHGQTWIHMTGGTDNKSIVALAVDSNGDLFAGTENDGIYRSANPATGMDQSQGLFPSGFVLEQNYPNPFNPGTVISYQLPVVRDVHLTIYNLLGQKVWHKRIANQPAGRYEFTIDLGNHASGLYLYRLEAGNFVETRKMVLLK